MAVRATILVSSGLYQYTTIYSFLVINKRVYLPPGIPVRNVLVNNITFDKQTDTRS